MQDPNIRPISVAEEVKNSFLDYSMSVIIARALPDVVPAGRDLGPGLRRRADGRPSVRLLRGVGVPAPPGVRRGRAE